MALVKRESGRWWRRGEERACCARLWGGSGLGGGKVAFPVNISCECACSVFMVLPTFPLCIDPLTAIILQVEEICSSNLKKGPWMSISINFHPT